MQETNKTLQLYQSKFQKNTLWPLQPSLITDEGVCRQPPFPTAFKMDALGTDTEANGHRSYRPPPPSRAPNSQSNDLPVIEVWEEENASAGRFKHIQDVQHLLEKSIVMFLVQASGSL